MFAHADNVPNIDLNNFENDRFCECEYVLTSARSLEACRNLGIRPADLLADGEDAGLSAGEREDKERQRRLRLMRARVERQRLINETLEDARQGLAVEGTAIRDQKDPVEEDQCLKRLPEDKVCSKSSVANKTRKNSINSIQMNGNKPNALLKELQFHQKRQTIEQQAKNEAEERIKNMESRLSRAERNKIEIEKRKLQEMESKRRVCQKKAVNVLHRRQQLEEEIVKYYRELERFQEITMRNAEEKIHQKWQDEQNKIQYEREYKELINRHNRQLIEEEETNRSYEAMIRIMDKDKQNEQFIQEKMDKMMESRCLANEAQKVREEIRKVYNLDSFDRKASRVELVNQILKQA